MKIETILEVLSEVHMVKGLRAESTATVHRWAMARVQRRKYAPHHPSPEPMASFVTCARLHDHRRLDRPGPHSVLEDVLALELALKVRDRRCLRAHAAAPGVDVRAGRGLGGLGDPGAGRLAPVARPTRTEDHPRDALGRRQSHHPGSEEQQRSPHPPARRREVSMGVDRRGQAVEVVLGITAVATPRPISPPPLLPPLA